MTDSIDLDEIETETDEASEGPDPNRGDWFWRGKGEPEDETPTAGTDADSGPAADSTDDGSGSETPTGPGAATPHVPRENRNRPVGMPTDQGGAGGTSARQAAEDERNDGGVPEEASGPHGGGADEMTMAFTYRAAKRLADPGFVFASAAWADWVGLVGEADAHVLNKFQRENGIDADFFNGSGTGPAERLAEITEMSMFFAERMVLVGTAEEEWIAEEAGWEFVPVETAAEKAGWELE
ncbi:DUF7124 domain-containing protein [Halalkalicoccus ordinarius]|uniref:DUF7124 domain-containing protein n=1 Tax=Halalkalicoccus ordinarius TaxID=3116651 RepID=UPI00300F0C63